MLTHVMFGVTITSCWIGLKSNDLKLPKKLIIVIAFYILWLFAALRYGFGNDYFSYMGAFYAVRDGSYSFGSEIIFEFLLKCFPNFYLFIAFSSAFTLYPIYKIIINGVNLQYAYISIFIYCINCYLFLMSLTSIRQFMAVSVFVYATYFSYKRKFLPYLLLIACSMMIHTSAIILFPVYYWANDRRISNKTIRQIVLITFFFVIFSDLFNDLTLLILTKVGKPNYIYYFQTGGGSSLRSVILSTVFLVYTAINIQYLKGYQLMCAKIYFLGNIIGVLVYNVNILGRLQFYFDIYSLVVIPSIIVFHKKNNAKKINRIIQTIIFPLLMVAIYMGRYMNFFNAPIWNSFTSYRTFLSVL